MRLLPAVLFTLLALTACKKQLDSDKLVAMIRDEMLGPKGIKTTSVTCPKDRELKANDKFTCEVKTTTNETLTFEVSVKDADGNVEVNLVGEVIDPAKIVATVAPRIGMPTTTTATCDRLVSNKQPFTCELVAGQERRKVEIKPGEGGYTFNDLSKPAAEPAPDGAADPAADKPADDQPADDKPADE